jgi:hypothetical protein
VPENLGILLHEATCFSYSVLTLLLHNEGVSAWEENVPTQVHHLTPYNLHEKQTPFGVHLSAFGYDEHP